LGNIELVVKVFSQNRMKIIGKIVSIEPVLFVGEVYSLLVQNHETFCEWSGGLSVRRGNAQAARWSRRTESPPLHSLESLLEMYLVGQAITIHEGGYFSMYELSSFPPRLLGTTSLEVSPLCIGCSSLGNMPEAFGYGVTEEQALATIRVLFDGSVNFLDTAASYGDGESERRLGLVLRERGGLPSGMVLATKADRNLQTGDFSGEQVRRSVERSLRLLGLEQIQLLYLHDPEHISFEQAMAPGGPVETLRRCQEEGLIQHLGVAGGPLDLMTRFVETDLFEAAISHNRYTLLNTEADAFWDLCVQRNVAALNAAPYGSGILAKGPATYPRYMYAEADARVLELARRVEGVCQHHGVPLAAAALQFSLRDPRINSTIVGISRPERLAETLELAEWAIPAGVWDEIAALRARSEKSRK